MEYWLACMTQSQPVQTDQNVNTPASLVTSLSKRGKEAEPSGRRRPSLPLSVS